jgi:hypothetical protein
MAATGLRRGIILLMILLLIIEVLVLNNAI